MICLFCGNNVYRTPVQMTVGTALDRGRPKPIRVEREGQFGHARDCPYSVIERRDRRRRWDAEQPA